MYTRYKNYFLKIKNIWVLKQYLIFVSFFLFFTFSLIPINQTKYNKKPKGLGNMRENI